MSDPLAHWPRPHHEPGGGQPHVFFVVFGASTQGLALSRSNYRCSGVPASLDLMAYGPDRHPEVLDSFREGYLWDQLRRSDPALASSFAAQTQCVVVRGTLADARTLDELRDAIGLVTCLLDHGGVGLFDPQSFRWWSAPAWKDEVFAPAKPVPHRHVLILTSPEPHGSTWFHTRGLRTFGRPDLSVRGVPATQHAAIKELIDRFIDYQALGGVIADGQAIRMKSLPEGMVCVHACDEDDADFNNAHVEIRWPASSSTGQ